LAIGIGEDRAVAQAFRYRSRRSLFELVHRINSSAARIAPHPLRLGAKTRRSTSPTPSE